MGLAATLSMDLSSDDVGPEEMRLMLRSACPSEYGACVAEASCSAEWLLVWFLMQLCWLMV